MEREPTVGAAARALAGLLMLLALCFVLGVMGQVGARLLLAPSVPPPIVATATASAEPSATVAATEAATPTEAATGTPSPRPSRTPRPRPASRITPTP